MKVKHHKFDLSPTLDELDEVFVKNATVHIERMSDTSFWIGINSPGLPGLMVNTGVHRGTWFFNVYEDVTGGKSYSVRRPRRGAVPALAKDGGRK